MKFYKNCLDLFLSQCSNLRARVTDNFLNLVWGWQSVLWYIDMAIVTLDTQLFCFHYSTFFCPLICSFQLMLCCRNFILYFWTVLLPMATCKCCCQPSSYLLVTWLLMFITFEHVDSITPNVNPIMVIVYGYYDLIS